MKNSVSSLGVTGEKENKLKLSLIPEKTCANSLTKTNVVLS
jgi:hypothetical protein